MRRTSPATPPPPAPKPQILNCTTAHLLCSISTIPSGLYPGHANLSRILLEYFIEILDSLPIHLIMAADIKQNNFLVGNQESQGNTVAMGEADGVATLQFAAQGM